MKLRLTLQRPGGPSDDIVVDCDGQAPVGHVAGELLRTDPRSSADVHSPTLAWANGSEQALDPMDRVGESGLRSGDAVRIVSARTRRTTRVSESAAVLRVTAGPDAGREFTLPSGSTTIGRARENAVRLTDPLVSKVHARVHITETVEIADLGSSNGVLVGGESVTRTVLQAGDTAVLGDTRVTVTMKPRAGGAPGVGSTSLSFNRSPVLQPRYEEATHVAPEPPERKGKQGLPIIPVVVPILIGGVLYALTMQVFSLVFIAMSPLLMLGQWLESRISGRRAFVRESAEFRRALEVTRNAVFGAMAQEREVRQAENPSVDEVAAAIAAGSALLWSRRPGESGWAAARLGLGRQPSRQVIELPTTHRTSGDLWAELAKLQDQASHITDVPVVADWTEGAVGIAGPSELVSALARSLLLQLVGLHSPSELSLAVVSSTRHSGRWDWMKWLPHVGGEYSPLSRPALAAGGPVGTALVAEVEELLAARSAGPSTRESVAAGPFPAVLLLVDDDAPVERARLVGLAETGAAYGIHVLWVASAVSKLPAACRTWVDISSAEVVSVSRRTEPAAEAVQAEYVDEASALRAARTLSPVVDAGARPDDASDLPSRVSFLALATDSLASSSDAVIERWRETQSVPDESDQEPLEKDHSLRALVGEGPDGPFQLDLRDQGPHALVGGTTGSGKSEFLQTWILGMAATHSPSRVSFLLVDYKGGAAFADCVRLPHTVGLVTDLSPHLVGRALTSLRAELRYREHLLQSRDYKAKDLLEMERRRDPAAPPSLVIVVDEFAALAKEVPEFVDGVIDVAQRGRSLGLHLVLATQRPAGVIKDSLRTNTNLRVALRMNDEADSSDVVGTAVASTFDPSLPGRGVVRVGPGRLVPFQAAYVGGRTPAKPPPPPIIVETLGWDVPTRWKEHVKRVSPGAGPLGPTDIERTVSNIAKAARQAGIPVPRKPWLPTLPATYEWKTLSTQSRDDEEREGTALMFGRADDPDNQTQTSVAFWPDKDGAMAVYGTGGSGKTTLLRTLATAAGLACARDSRTIVYGLDFAAGSLRNIETLPNVGSVIRGDDTERVTRLLDWLSDEVDARSRRFTDVNASSLLQYRRLANRPDEPRILLLVDGIGTFWQDYQDVKRSRTFDKFTAIVLAGRSVGVHAVLTADRPNAVPSALASSVQRRVLLRQANENDEAMLGLPAGALDSQTPPGRGYVDGLEVQVAVLGNSVDTTVQAREIETQAQNLRRFGVSEAAAIGRMPEQVQLAELPPLRAGEPTIGISATDLGPATLKPNGCFLVTGPRGSGVSLALGAICHSLRRSSAGIRLLHVGTRRAVLPAIVDVGLSVTDAAEVDSVVEAWTALANDRTQKVVLVLEDVPGLAASQADPAVQRLVTAFREAERFVVASGEISALTSSYTGLVKMLQTDRSGLVLQPDHADGDTVLRTSFPRVARSGFPPGRGILTQPGRMHEIQVALP